MGWAVHEGVEVLHLDSLESLGGVKAVFTGRRGGISERWNGGLNWSRAVGDTIENVTENRRRSLAVLGLVPDQMAIAGLVHGNRVVAVTGEEPFDEDGVRLIENCDALITDRHGVALVVTAADCVPILLYDPARRAVSAIHAGWRGTVAGVAGRAVAAMADAYGCMPADIRAAIGPSIGPCCYEVDEAVAGPLRAYYGARAGVALAPGRESGKYQLDLWEANRQDLIGAGVREIEVTGSCTSCGVERLFSHRAERGTAGRGAAIIALV